MEPITDSLASSFAIFALRLASMAVSSVRLILVSRAAAGWAASLGFFESIAFVVAIGIVASNLDSIPGLAANSFGFVAGTVVGIRLERGLGFGYVTVLAFTRHSLPVVTQLYEHGYPATIVSGQGRSGPVDVVVSVVQRRAAPQVIGLIEEGDGESFVQWDEVGALTAPRSNVLGG